MPKRRIDPATSEPELVKQKGFDHLLKSITVTTREFPATRTKPAQVAHTYRAQLHSPLQASEFNL